MEICAKKHQVAAKNDSVMPIYSSIPQNIIPFSYKIGLSTWRFSHDLDAILQCFILFFSLQGSSCPYFPFVAFLCFPHHFPGLSQATFDPIWESTEKWQRGTTNGNQGQLEEKPLLGGTHSAVKLLLKRCTVVLCGFLPPAAIANDMEQRWEMHRVMVQGI